MKSAMLLPKEKWLTENEKKKRKTRQNQTKRPESILQIKDGRCFLCMMLNNDNTYHPVVHRHHVFFGKKCKEKCDEEGLTVYLCIEHHLNGKQAVHGNRKNDLMLKKYAQTVYEQNHSREEFIEKFVESYL